MTTFPNAHKIALYARDSLNDLQSLIADTIDLAQEDDILEYGAEKAGELIAEYNQLVCLTTGVEPD